MPNTRIRAAAMASSDSPHPGSPAVTHRIFLLNEFPAADHRREHAMALDIVMIENQIDMDQGEHQKSQTS